MAVFKDEGDAHTHMVDIVTAALSYPWSLESIIAVDTIGPSYC
jgi:hypothetical protein